MRKRGTVQRGGVAALVKKRQNMVRRDWGKHRSLMRFLDAYFPTEWAAIRDCSLTWVPMEETGNPGWFKVVPRHACHRIPYCIQCTKFATQRRVRNAFDQFARATPRGRRPRFIHLVITAPINQDGVGWGVQASQDPKAFGGVLWDALEELYGDGLGGIFSYHDVGERLFAKRHPHMDLTLNGYRVLNAEAKLTPTFNLTAGGRRHFDATVIKHARKLFPDARITNVWIGHAVTGVKPYYAQLKYQMREIVDFRKLVYRDGQVHWLSYKASQRTTFTPDQFLDGLLEYQMRLKAWNKAHRSQLHRAYGIMSKRSIGATERAIGGAELPHDADCPCGDCGDWHRVFLDDVHNSVWAPPLRPD